MKKKNPGGKNKKCVFLQLSLRPKCEIGGISMRIRPFKLHFVKSVYNWTFHYRFLKSIYVIGNVTNTITNIRIRKRENNRIDALFGLVCKQFNENPIRFFYIIKYQWNIKGNKSIIKLLLEM